jgi:hypothetical protein
MHPTNLIRCRRQVLYWGFLLLGAGTLVGCGGDSRPLVPVEGTVTLGGKIYTGGGYVSLFAIEEDAKGPVPEGDIDSAGRYAIKTAGKEGAPPGKYRVTVRYGSGDRSQYDSFNSLYSSWNKSPLSLEVIESAPAGTYDLKLMPLPQ